MKKFIIDTICVLILVDIAIVFFSLLVLALGGEIQHVPFWDAQMKFVVDLLNN